ncbi:hypothetical protein F5Y05DRAFT_413501 [Hypoxylon sp. FL0543]|nr:hypothetical protein F5Y05DRAFT_413501 [Hypoxylon sp. FL0543]
MATASRENYTEIVNFVGESTRDANLAAFDSFCGLPFHLSAFLEAWSRNLDHLELSYHWKKPGLGGAMKCPLIIIVIIRYIFRLKQYDRDVFLVSAESRL